MLVSIYLDFFLLMLHLTKGSGLSLIYASPQLLLLLVIIKYKNKTLARMLN